MRGGLCHFVSPDPPYLGGGHSNPQNWGGEITPIFTHHVCCEGRDGWNKRMVGTKSKCERVSTSNSEKKLRKGMKGHKGGNALTKGNEKRDGD